MGLLEEKLCFRVLPFKRSPFQECVKCPDNSSYLAFWSLYHWDANDPYSSVYRRKTLLPVGEARARTHLFSSKEPLEYVELYQWVVLKQPQRQFLVMQRYNLSINQPLCRWYEWCQGWQGFSFTALCAGWLLAGPVYYPCEFWQNS